MQHGFFKRGSLDDSILDTYRYHDIKDYILTKQESNMMVPKALFQLKKIPDPDHYIEAIVRNIPNKYGKKADNYLQF